MVEDTAAAIVAGSGRPPAGRSVSSEAQLPPTLTVVIPAWNEAERIEECVEQVLARLSDQDAEIVVVDDGSSDGTAARCAAWVRAHPAARVRLVRAPHRGKGAALRAGVAVSRGEVVAFIDADLDVPPEEIARLLRERATGRLDVVVGSKRVLAWRQVPRPFGRKVMSLAFSGLVAVLFRLPVRDTQTGVKLFSGPWLRRAVTYTRIDGFLFDVEILALAAAQGLRMGEAQVRVVMRRPASRIGMRDVVHCLGELAMVPAALHRARRALPVAGASPRRSAPSRAERVAHAPVGS